MLDWLRRSTRRPSSRPPPPFDPSVELFDPAFQRTLEALAILSRRVFSGRMRAERRSRRVGAGVEFAEHRPYVAGDDIRAIDWNIYRRHRRFLVRLSHEEQDVTVHLLVDSSASMAFGTPSKLLYAEKLAAALAYVALANLDRVAVHTFTDRLTRTLPPTRGKNRIFKVLRFLSETSAGGTTKFREAARVFTARTKRKGPVVILTDGYDDEGIERGIDTLRYHGFEPVLVHLVDAAEVDAAAETRWLGDVELVDQETGAVRRTTLTRDALRAYTAARQRQRERIGRACRERQVACIDIDVATPLDDAVVELLVRGELLG